MTATVRRPLDSGNARARRRRLLLILSVVLTVAVAGVAVAREHWLALRQGLDEMRLALIDARTRQQTMRLRLAAAEERLHLQLDRLGLVAEDSASTGGDIAPALASVSNEWAVSAPPDLSARLAALAADLAAGAEARNGTDALHRLAIELRGGDRDSASPGAALADELDGLARALAASSGVDWSVLEARLDALRRAANHLPPPRLDNPLPELPRVAPARATAPAQYRRRGQPNPFRQAMRSQLEVARAAVQLRDLALLRLSGAGAERLLRGHYPAGSADAALFARHLNALSRGVKAMDRATLVARIQTLADDLAEPMGAPTAAASPPAR